MAFDDSNRERQMTHAAAAMSQGYTKALWYCTYTATTCITCKLNDGHIFDISVIAYGFAMHEFCQCVFTYREKTSYAEPPLEEPLQSRYPVPPRELIKVPIGKDPDLEKSEEAVEVIGDPNAEWTRPKRWTCCSASYAAFST